MGVILVEMLQNDQKMTEAGSSVDKAAVMLSLLNVMPKEEKNKYICM